MRILHVSDMHISKKTSDASSMQVIKRLADEILGISVERQIDLICFTGDLVYKGGKGFNTISEAFDEFESIWIDQVLNCVDLEHLKRRLLICPGNHDIERDLIDDTLEIGLLETMKKPDGYNSLIISHDNNTHYFNRVSKYKQFEDEFYKKYDHPLISQDSYQSVLKYVDSIQTVGILSLNSAWRCNNSSSDYGSLLVSKDHIAEAITTLEDSSIKIAMMHHHNNYFHNAVRDGLESSLHQHFDILLCGHSHKAKTSYSNTMLESLLISVAPNISVENKDSDSIAFSMGFAVIDYDNKDMKCSLKYRRYCDTQRMFIDNLDVSETGRIEYNLLDRSHKTPVQQQAIKIREILRSNTEELDQHMLSSIADTKAPKSFDEIFVEPPIYKKKDYDKEKGEEVQYVNIEDIIKSSANMLILGSKESGKTILLDKLYKDFLENYDTYRFLPVLLDYNEVGYRDIDDCIRSFLKTPQVIFNNFMLEYNIVLLIDNFVTYGNDHKTKRYNAFIEKYPKVRVILTYNVYSKDDVPVEIINDDNLREYDRLQIDDFKTKHIRSLICNWFCTANDTTFANSKLENIKQVFMSFNLPRTPLSISIFLWIIEQQESYRPQNNAAMVENFIDSLLEKTKFKHVFSDEFDFTNKLRLLADTAKLMLYTNDSNYRVKLSALNDFMNDRFKTMGYFLPTSTDSIIHEFEKRGLFLIETEGMEQYVRFKFKFLFQYFLAKVAEFDHNFYEQLLAEDKYLMYYEIIDYLTAIKRDARGILELVITRMEDMYSDINEHIDKLEYKHDQIFVTKKSVIDSVDEDILHSATSQSRPSIDTLDRIDDEILQNIPSEKGIPSIEEELSVPQKLQRSWILSAQCLRNSEEIDNSDGIKTRAYISVVRCAMSFAFLYKYILNKNYQNLTNEMDLALHAMMPLFHQLFLKGIIGTKKLQLIIEDVMKSRLNSSKTSDIEKFIDVFLYADIRGKQYHKYIRQLMNNSKHKYIKDMMVFKLLTYYYLRTLTETDRGIFENLISELLLKRKKAAFTNKSNQIKQLQENRKDAIKKGSED